MARCKRGDPWKFPILINKSILSFIGSGFHNKLVRPIGSLIGEEMKIFPKVFLKEETSFHGLHANLLEIKQTQHKLLSHVPNTICQIKLKLHKLNEYLNSKAILSLARDRLATRVHKL